MEIFMEFLSKAENGIATHIKHANTKEAAKRNSSLVSAPA